MRITGPATSSPAACILRQILSGQVGGAPWQAFAYKHNGVGNVRPRLPVELTTAKIELARLMQAERNRRLGRAEESHNQLDSAQDFEERVQDPFPDNDFAILEKALLEGAENVILWVILVFDSLYKLAKKEPVVSIPHPVLA